jgi:hypothetical protein
MSIDNLGGKGNKPTNMNQQKRPDAIKPGHTQTPGAHQSGQQRPAASSWGSTSTGGTGSNLNKTGGGFNQTDKRDTRDKK